MNGCGTFLWKDGKKYIGHFKDDLRDGEGTFFFPDGRRYEGTWLRGKK